MSVSGILNVTRNALSTYQLAIDVTGGNIANINTPGYSRQRTVLVSRGNIQAGAVTAQLSVEVKTIERIFDAFTELQVTEQRQKLGFSQTKSDSLQRVEIIYDETQGNKLNDLFGRFWEAWSDLSYNAGGQVERYAVLSAAKVLAEGFNSYGDQLYNLQKNIDAGLGDTIKEINGLAEEIASLNKQLAMIPHDSGEANSLMDKRTERLKELADQIDFHYVEGNNGALNIYLPDGQALVEGEITRKLILVGNSTTAFRDVAIAGNEQNIINDFLTANSRGALGAKLAVRDDILANYLGKLDDLAKTLMDSVNEIHRSAYDVNGNLGGDFFVLKQSSSSSYARNLAVNASLASAPTKIAASATVSGDGEKAGEIAALKDRMLMNNGSITLGDYYASMVGEIGRDVAAASNAAGYENTILEQLKNQRESISGVSLDEEMINLVKFQMAYNAAGKLCQVANELMDTLMDLAG